MILNNICIFDLKLLDQRLNIPKRNKQNLTHLGVFIFIMDRFNPHHKHTDFLIGNTYKIRDWKWNEWKDKRSIEEIEVELISDRLMDLELLEANYAKILETRTPAITRL